MPCLAYCDKPHDINPHLWQKCRDVVEKQMLDAGWIRRSKKFGEVHLRKSLQLFRVQP